MAAANVSLETVGSTLSKIHGTGLTTWEINLVRFITALLSLFLIAFAGILAPLAWKFWHRCPTTPECYEMEDFGTQPEWGQDLGGVVLESRGTSALGGELRDKVEFVPGAWAHPPAMPTRDWAWVALGISLTTFLCPALGNYTLFLTSFLAWATLRALGPMYALPLGRLLKSEPVTKLKVLGTALAVAGLYLSLSMNHEKARDFLEIFFTNLINILGTRLLVRTRLRRSLGLINGPSFLPLPSSFWPSGGPQPAGT